MHPAEIYLEVPPMILASGSPRRRDLLTAMGLEFDVVVSGYDESSFLSQGVSPESMARSLAQEKLRYLLKAREGIAEGKLVIAMDTLVWADGTGEMPRQLGKPKDGKEAFAMLELLSGHWHSVRTGVAMRYGHWRGHFTCTTRVKFAKLSEEEIVEYVESGQPLDKAGAYGIQDDFGLRAVEAIEGSYTNVVGLPTQMLHEYLIAHFA